MPGQSFTSSLEVDDLEAAGRAALGGSLAGVVFGVAHGVFLVWALPPAIVGAIIGALGAAACGPALRRSRIHPLGMGGLLMLTALPVGVAAFAVSPLIGDSAWLVRATVVMCAMAGGLCGLRLRAGWWGVLALALVGFLVGGPGEPFIHEGPEARIVGFYFGLLTAIGTAGVAATAMVRTGGGRRLRGHSEQPG